MRVQNPIDVHDLQKRVPLEVQRLAVVAADNSLPLWIVLRNPVGPMFVVSGNKNLSWPPLLTLAGDRLFDGLVHWRYQPTESLIARIHVVLVSGTLKLLAAFLAMAVKAPEVPPVADDGQDVRSMLHDGLCGPVDMPGVGAWTDLCIGDNEVLAHQWYCLAIPRLQARSECAGVGLPQPPRSFPRRPSCRQPGPSSGPASC